MATDNKAFLETGMFPLLEVLNEDNNNNWGKMNAQQMIEHLRDFFMVSTGELKFDLAVPEEHLPKYLEFLRSDKPFKENTKAPASVLGEEPLSLRFNSLDEAKKALHLTVKHFFEYFEMNPGAKTLHPAFGNLGFDDWVLLHYKHVTHHLRQFGLMN
ncbi:MAG: DUF1569 domain-containing protein [Ferruginibacter sp.]